MRRKKIWQILPIFLLSCLLTSCDTSSISDNIQGTIENALPNLWVALAQLGAFLVTVFVFIKFAYKPIKKKMDERKDYVEKNIKDSETRLLDAKKSQDTAESNIKASRVKANEIITAAQRQADQEARKIIDDAQKEIEHQILESEKDIANKKLELERQAHNEIVNTALDASKEILGREINQEDNERIIDDFLNKMEEEKKD